MNINLADTSRFLVGSNNLKITPFYIKNFNIPGLSFDHISLPTKSGIILHEGADNISFDSLELEILLDSSFETYFELLDIALSEVDWINDRFNTPSFDLWVKVINQQKEEMFSVEFMNCRISSISSIPLDTSAEMGTTFTVSLIYDFFVVKRSNKWDKHHKISLKK